MDKKISPCERYGTFVRPGTWGGRHGAAFESAQKLADITQKIQFVHFHDFDTPCPGSFSDQATEGSGQCLIVNPNKNSPLRARSLS